MDATTTSHPADIGSMRDTGMVPFALAVAAAAALVYRLCWATTTPDMFNFLLPWFEHIERHGPVGAFAVPFSNYTPPYLYLLAATTPFAGWVDPISLIKLLSVAGTGALAGAMHALLRAAEAPHAGRIAIATFLVPTAVLNAPFLGQCDAFWVAACLMAVAAMIRGRIVAMLVWCGVALAFKVQAAFLAPFIFAMLIRHRAPISWWSIPALIYAAAMLPAWAAGWPALDLATVYLRQAAYTHIMSNVANPWIFVEHFYPGDWQDLVVSGYALAGAATLAYVLLFRARTLDTARIVEAALLSALMLPFLLPKMHERYYFLADMLAIALAAIVRDRRSAMIAVAVQTASLLSIFSYTVNRPAPVIAASLVAALALAMLVRDLGGSAGRPIEAKPAA